MHDWFLFVSSNNNIQRKGTSQTHLMVDGKAAEKYPNFSWWLKAKRFYTYVTLEFALSQVCHVDLVLCDGLLAIVECFVRTGAVTFVITSAAFWVLGIHKADGSLKKKELKVWRKKVNIDIVLKLHTAVQHKKADCFVLRLLKLTRMRTDFSAMVDGTNNSSQPRCFICSTISISSLWPQIVHILFNFVKVLLPKTLFMFQEEQDQGV